MFPLMLIPPDVDPGREVSVRIYAEFQFSLPFVPPACVQVPALGATLLARPEAGQAALRGLDGCGEMVMLPDLESAPDHTDGRRLQRDVASQRKPGRRSRVIDYAALRSHVGVARQRKGARVGRIQRIYAGRSRYGAAHGPGADFIDL